MGKTLRKDECGSLVADSPEGGSLCPHYGVCVYEAYVHVGVYLCVYTRMWTCTCVYTCMWGPKCGAKVPLVFTFLFCLKVLRQAVVAHTFNPSTQKAEAGPFL